MRLLISLILFFLFSSSAWATNWYVRDSGGNYGTTSTTCNGLYNTVYTAGNGPNCALEHPAWAIGAGYVPEAGSGYTTTTELIQSGDTLYIDGDSDIVQGTQAKYEIGCGMPNVAYPGNSYCSNAGLNLIVAGTSGHNTQIIGTGIHKPQLWGNGGTQYILESQGGYVTYQNLEITTHASCGVGFGVNSCSGGTGYATDGIRIEDGGSVTGNNYLFQDIYIHNMKRYGIVAINDIGTGGNLSGILTFTRAWLIGNQQGGFSTSSSANWTDGVTLNWNQPIAEWSGCEEAYPLTNPGIDNPLNYSNCTAQDGTDGSGTNGIIADNLDVGFSGSLYSGNWTIIGPGSISLGTKNGLDLLHGGGSDTTVSIDKMRFEGNAGIAFKSTAANTYVTNSLIIGDCSWWYGSAQAIAGGMSANGSGVCRAGSNAQFAITGINQTKSFYNNTIISVADTNFEELGACDSSDVINIKNNIIINGYNFIDDSTISSGGGDRQASYLYIGGSDDNTGINCTAYTLNEDYNIVYGRQTGDNVTGLCTAAHDLCGTSPGFVAGTFPVGVYQGASNTFYQGQSGITLLPIDITSAAKFGGKNGLSYWNTENDYYNVARPTLPSMGGLEYQSCAVNGFAPCFFNTDCCSNTCTANVCDAPPAVVAPPGNIFRGSMKIKGSVLLQ